MPDPQDFDTERDYQAEDDYQVALIYGTLVADAALASELFGDDELERYAAEHPARQPLGYSASRAELEEYAAALAAFRSAALRRRARDRWIEALLGGRLRFHTYNTTVEAGYWIPVYERWQELYRAGRGA
jgi:hypothetical protein